MDLRGRYYGYFEVHFMFNACGFLLSGIWFGLNIFAGIITKRLKMQWLSYFNALFASIIPVFIIASTLGIYPVQNNGLHNVTVFIVSIATVVITSAIVTRKKSIIRRKGKELLFWGLDGLLMEIPQRLMMQSFIYGILSLSDVSSSNLYAVMVTALVWCLGILMQAFLLKTRFDKELAIDIAASFVFSLGMGYVYQETGLIVISMIAHFCERVLSCSVFVNEHS